MLNHTSHGDPEAPAVVLLHGFLGSAGDWNHIAGALSEEFLCVTPDLPGHGGSIGLPDDAYNFGGAARAVTGLMDGLGVRRATVAGYSMGGRLALYLALRHPERCAGLFLESASPGIEDVDERAARRGADEERARWLETGDFEEFLRGWYRQPLFASLVRREGMVEALIEARRRNAPRELARSLRGMGTGSQPSLWGEVSGLRVQTLATSGELDEKFAGIARRMAGLYPKMRVALIPGAGHNVHLETPEEYIMLLRNAVGSKV